MTQPTRSHARPPRILAVAGILLAGLLFAAGGALWWGGGRDAAAIGGRFALENGDGQRVTDRDFLGKYMLVYFGYTFCPDVCPTTLNEIAEALDQLGAEADRVQPVFITVDPGRDTPAVVKRYVAAFSPKIVGLTGSEASIAETAKEYRVYVAKRRTGEGANDYTVDHSSVLYLMGPNGAFLAPIRADESGEQMARDIGKYLS
ncbi:MAG: SCO family protein [Acetobacteraceae bacterium]|nr:SCO family protein [Acetobacteraceae bacterium]